MELEIKDGIGDGVGDDIGDKDEFHDDVGDGGNKKREESFLEEEESDGLCSLSYTQGGGWCNNVTDCLSRSNNRLGSSKHMEKEVAFSGMLSNEQKFNPDFYNWNRIKVRYCDGASFTGDVEAVNPVIMEPLMARDRFGGIGSALNPKITVVLI
ncbi:hypothetical protein Q3G72_028166 [Acer saccharum]|nr:hypothetical protein Q3G72_028166 [Acer saccharum]